MPGLAEGPAVLEERFLLLEVVGTGKMKRKGLILLPFVLVIASGCVRHRLLTPMVTLGHVVIPRPNDKDMDLLGKVEAEAAGGQVLFIFGYGDPVWECVEKGAGKGTSGIRPPVDGAVMTAVFKALEKSPGANAIVDARIAESSSNFLLWKSWQVKVSGTAAKVPPPLTDER